MKTRLSSLASMLLSAALIATFVLAAPNAQAQQEWSLQRFRPAIHSLSTFTVESARVSHQMTINAFAMYNLAGPLLQGRLDTDVVESFGTANIVASIGLLDRLSFGFDVPIHAGGSGIFLDGTDMASAGLGDIRLSLKAAALEPLRVGPGIALGLDVMVPSGSKGGYGREEGVTVVPKILLDAVLAHVHLMTNLYYVARTESFQVNTDPATMVDFGDNLLIGDEIGMQTAVAIFLGSTDFRMIIEGRFESLVDRWFEPEATSLEFTWGLHWRHGSGLALGGGASFGVLGGHGDPDWRGFLSIGYQPGRYIPIRPAQAADRDGDGIGDDVDQCPDDPEDKDGFEDADGCPEKDNDKDGILDGADKCPNEPEDVDGDRDDDGCPDGDKDKDGVGDDLDQCPDVPEDKDGFEDKDGCPDTDNDKDGIPDTTDKCPMQAEDKDGDRDTDGCPDGDGDGDGIADDADKCPTQPEDKDGFEDADGCPDLDNDKDGIPDATDKCPTDAEDKDGFKDDDGCPEPDNDGDGILDADDKCRDVAEDRDGCQDDDGCPEEGRVCITKDKIVITEKIFFKTNKATIRARSYSLLTELAATLRDNPHIKLIEVQGHTDSRGGDGYNMKLSEARAAAVRNHLVIKLGVGSHRLTSQGYGESRPIADNGTEEGRELNRRVEFHILTQSTE